MFVEQAAKVASGEPQVATQVGFGAFVQGTADDHLDSAADKLRRLPGHRSGNAVRPATQTGPKAGRFRRCGQLKGPHIVRAGAGATSWPTINAGCHHGGKRRHPLGIARRLADVLAASGHGAGAERQRRPDSHRCPQRLCAGGSGRRSDPRAGPSAKGFAGSTRATRVARIRTAGIADAGGRPPAHDRSSRLHGALARNTPFIKGTEYFSGAAPSRQSPLVRDGATACSASSPMNTTGVITPRLSPASSTGTRPAGPEHCLPVPEPAGCPSVSATGS